MLQQDVPDDYVIATGEQYSVREFINRAAEKLEMEVEWRGNSVDETYEGKPIIRVDKKYFRPTEVETLLGIHQGEVNLDGSLNIHLISW